MIEAVQISTNRYAPDEAQAVNMYRMDDGELLTLGQLMAAVCIKAGACMESQTIAKVNSMDGNTMLINIASGYLKELAEDKVSNWGTTRNWLINTLGVSANLLPSTIFTYADRFKAISAMKVKLEALTRQAQEDMIDVQSMTNKRDVAFSTGTSLIKELGASQNNTASVL